MPALVAGVDSSTQSTKVELRTIDSGELIARASAAHPPTSPPISEQDPESWWQALVACFDQVREHTADIVAVSVAAQQHGLVLVSEAGLPLRPAKLWNDTTSAPQAEQLVESAGATTWARGCGSVPVASFTITKLAWVLEHEPALAEQVAMVMLPHDYLTWRLTGQHVTDRGDASGTGWFDPGVNAYNTELLGHIGDPGLWEQRLPSVLSPDSPAGEPTPAACAALGLRPQVVVGPGTGDNMAAALGLGARTGDVVISLGTSGTVYGVSPSATADPSGAVAGFADASGQFLPLVCTLNATKVTDTVATWLGTDAPGLSALALEADDRGDGPILVPYFDGERTPNLPAATGSFVGLRNDTTREDIARAAHDGVVCGLLGGMEALIYAGVQTSGRLILIGGGSRSAAYRDSVARLTGSAVLVPDHDETVATGAAVQAAVIASGTPVGDVSDGWMLGRGTTVEPRTSGSTEAIRRRYRQAAGG